MDKDLKQLIRQAKNIKLSHEEKSSIKDSLLNFISENPVRPGTEPRLGYGSNIFLTKLNFASAMAIFLIITVLVGGGVAVGAGNALPGDTLYPVKVGINEEVQGWLSVSEEAKANWEVERAQRRLEEAETLATDGSLDIEARENIEANFEAHADRVKERIEKFESNEDFHAAADLSSKFEISLKAHQKILNRLTAETKDEVKKEVRPIEFRVQSRAKALGKVRERMELRAAGSVNAGTENDDEEKNENENEVEVENGTDVELNLEQGTIKANGGLRARLGL